MLARSALLACLLIAGCKKPVAEAPPPEPISEPSAATPAPSTPVPATPKPSVVEATPAPNYLAPAGIYFLLAQASVETAAGITGLPPGTQLQQTGPTEYTAPDGHKLTLRPDQVTNDLRIAQQIAGADVAAQHALRQQMQVRRPASAPAAAQSAQPAAANPPPRATAPAPSLGGSGALGASHTRVKDGYLWQKDRSGNWVRVRPVR